jgi:hypothetical protein
MFSGRISITFFTTAHKFPENATAPGGEVAWRRSVYILNLDYFRFFLAFPQASPCVHSFRTARVGFSVAQIFAMRDIAITAGVDIALPVIAQGWFCGSSRRRTVERFPKRASVAGNPGVAASSETVSHGGTAKPARRDPDATAPSVQMRHRSSWPAR